MPKTVMVKCRGGCGQMWDKSELFHVQTHSGSTKRCPLKMCGICWVMLRSLARDNGAKFSRCRSCRRAYGPMFRHPKPAPVKEEPLPNETSPDEPMDTSSAEDMMDEVVPFVPETPLTPTMVDSIWAEVGQFESMSTDEFLAHLVAELAKFD